MEGMAGNSPGKGCILWHCSIARAAQVLAASHLQMRDPLVWDACVLGFPFTCKMLTFSWPKFYCCSESLNAPHFIKLCIKLW